MRWRRRGLLSALKLAPAGAEDRGMRIQGRASLVAVAVALLAAAALVVPALAATRGVRMTDNAFGPRALTVRAGTAVVWRNAGRAAHNAVATRAPQRFASPLVRRGGSYRRVLRRRGTYSVVCTLHAGMRMTVRVR